MLLVAVIIGLVAPFSGVVLSCQVDVPTGPTIVLVNVGILILCYAWRGLRSPSATR